MNQDFTYDRIEAYLLNKMPAEARRQFESELKQDEQLAARFQEQETEHKLMETIVEKKLLRDLKKWQAEDDAAGSGNTSAAPKKETKVIPFYRRRTVLAFAASLLFLVVALFWLNTNREPDYMALINTYDPAFNYALRSTDDSGYSGALVKIEQKKYPEAITELEKLKASAENYPDLYYFLGIAHQKSGNYQAAIPYFDQYLNNDNNDFVGRAGYLLGLSYLGIRNVEKAKQILKKGL